MNPNALPEEVGRVQERAPEQEGAVKAAASWLNQFARTLKTCRLYDASNPTVVRFREDLGSALRRLLNDRGALTYRFTSEDVFFEEESLHPAKSRDDNLALPFYRDGVRTLTLKQGIEQREVDALLAAILRVSGQSDGDDDLVTLLWEANLQHVDVDYVPSEGEIGMASQESGPLLPWPSAAPASAEPPGESAEAQTDEASGRSDDWTVGDLTVEIEAGFEELEALAPTELARFREEYLAEHGVPPLTATLAITDAYLSAEPTEDDLTQVATFLPRVLRQAVTQGKWLEAREAVVMLRQGKASTWNMETFLQELQQPISVSAAIERLDQQEAAALVDLVGFARLMGEMAVDWLMLLLAESQNQRNRKMLAEAIAFLCKNNPERLAPSLQDRRWFVVRNAVHILGWIGGNQIVGLLDAVTRHPEPRVRQEVIAALGKVDARLARPLLWRLLDSKDARMFTAVVRQLGATKDPQTARLLIAILHDPAFEERSTGEQRVVYSALSGCGGDEILADLEGDLHRAAWFSRNQEPHRQAIARCIARIGTPLARMILERGMQSRRAPVRKACEDAIGALAQRQADEAPE
jgi:HEAT repeat protein